MYAEFYVPKCIIPFQLHSGAFLTGIHTLLVWFLTLSEATIQFPTTSLEPHTHTTHTLFRTSSHKDDALRLLLA